MKKFLFILISSLLCSSTIAQINHPLVEEGKVWIYKGSSYLFDEEDNYKKVEWEETYCLRGDTTIDAHHCLKLYVTSNSPYKSYDNSCIGAMYEKDGNVYYIASGNTSSAILYNFSCNVGDIVKMDLYNIQNIKWDEYELIINEKRFVKYYDEYLTVINWSPLYPINGEIVDSCSIWIEGIGSPLDLLNSNPIWYTGNSIHKELLTCKLNDQIIYDKDEFWTSAQFIENDVSFTAGQMATIILPTAPDAGKGKYYRLDRVEGSEIVFEQELQPLAHVPYIIVPSEDFSIDPCTLDLAGLSSDTVSVEGVSFIGTYGRKELNEQEGYYIDIIDTTPDCLAQERPVIGALRAYLQVTWNDPYNQGGTKVPEEKMPIVLHDNGTDIASPFVEAAEASAIFDLQGRRLYGKPASGIYIESGRKRAVK